MYRLASVFVLLIFSLPVFAVSATQTGWSGGPGLYGPVTDWTDRFFDQDDTRWMTGQGSVELRENYIEIEIDNMMNTYSVRTGDIDGDGDQDVSVAPFQWVNLSWYENTDGSGMNWLKHTISSSHMYIVSIHIADVDGDDDLDLIGATYTNEEIYWWENADGAGSSWAENRIESDYGSPEYCFAEDMDGDGDPDVLGCSYRDDELTVWMNENGSGTSWTRQVVQSDFDGATSVEAGDIDRDGDTDIVGTALEGGEISWWENVDGSGSTWYRHTISNTFASARNAHLTDLDSDDDLDVLGGAMNGMIIWWENLDSTGTAWSEHPIADAGQMAGSVFSSDVDGDLVPEVLVTGFHISWSNSATMIRKATSTPLSSIPAAIQFGEPSMRSTRLHPVRWSSSRFARRTSVLLSGHGPIPFPLRST